MPIVYPYLPTNTSFTADPLNLRFEEFIGDASGLNSLTVEDLSVGALRHNHLPRLVQLEGYTYSELTAAYPTDPNQNLFSVMKNVAFGSSGSVTGATDVLTHTQTTPLTLDMRPLVGVQHISAIIVLANINIQRIVVDAQEPFAAPCEDRHLVEVEIRVEDNFSPIPRNVSIQRTARALSPRVTINYEAAALKGSPLLTSTGAYDSKTNQDVAIRCCITRDDLVAAGLLNVTKVHLRLKPRSGGFIDRVEYNKGNLTVIPIHAKLNDV